MQVSLFGGGVQNKMRVTSEKKKIGWMLLFILFIYFLNKWDTTCEVILNSSVWYVQQLSVRTKSSVVTSYLFLFWVDH